MKCPECGCDIENESVKCPFCETKLQADVEKTPNVQNGKNIGASEMNKKILGYVLIVVAILFFVVAISRINNSKYQHYKEYYQECMDGYDDSKYSARTEGLLFYGAYSVLADEYKDMADEAANKLNAFRIQAGCLAIVGLVSLSLGIYFVKKEG